MLSNHILTFIMTKVKIFIKTKAHMSLLDVRHVLELLSLVTVRCNIQEIVEYINRFCVGLSPSDFIATLYGEG